MSDFIRFLGAVSVLGAVFLGTPGCRDDAASSMEEEADGTEGTEGTDEAGGGPWSTEVTPAVAFDRAGEAVIGPEGGSVRATAADGTVYTLAIPQGSLLAPETIRVSPVTGIDDIPLGGGFLSGAQFEPDGLVLWRPATLTVELAATPVLAGDDVAVGYGYQGAGEGFHLDLMRRDGNTLSLPVPHFSGMGAGMAAPADIADLASAQPGADQAYYGGQLAALLAGGGAPPDFAAVMVQWYDEAIAPALAGASDDEALRAVLQQYAHWSFLAENLWINTGWSELQQQLFEASGIDDRVAASRPVAAAALRAGVVRNNEACAANENLAAAEAAMRWQAIAVALGLDDEAYALDLSGVQAELCVQMLYGEVSFPQVPVVGQAELLQVTLGPSFDGETIDDSEAWSTHLHVEPLGTAEEATDDASAGSHQVTFTPTGDREVVLDVRGCLSTGPEFPVLNQTLCQTAVVMRGFEITPTEAVIVSAGGLLDFDALLFGLPHPAVEWSATAGMIDADGVFIAPAEEGTVTVTATSQTTAGLTRSATVTVGEPCMAMPRMFTVNSEELDGNEIYVGPSPSPVQLSHGTGFAKTGVNSARATMGSVEDRYNFDAHIEFGITTTPVLAEDVNVPAIVTVKVRFDVSGYDPDDPPNVLASADCGFNGLTFYPRGNDTFVTEPGIYTFDIATSLGDTIECYLQANGDIPVPGAPPVVEVSWGGIVDVQTTADYEICST